MGHLFRVLPSLTRRVSGPKRRARAAPADSVRPRFGAYMSGQKHEISTEYLAPVSSDRILGQRNSI